MSLSKQTHDAASCYLDIIEVPEASHEKDFSDAYTPWPSLSHASRTRGQKRGQKKPWACRELMGPSDKAWLVLRNLFIAGTSDELKQADTRCVLMLLRFY